MAAPHRPARQKPAPVTSQALVTDWARNWTPGSSPVGMPSADGLRFAFYGRVSTEDHQDPDTSQAWQVLRAQALVAGHGRIVAEFFDTGRSRTVPWARRPQAAALLAAMADPDRDFDAIVIGSSERAFYGNQFATMAPLFDHYGVEVWVPELGGGVDPQTAGQEELMVLLGILSKREIARARIRTRTAMTVQTRDQGRYLGGRPPYGYRLVDAGPHPNRALARHGVRIQRLDTDLECGPIVSWIFAQRLGRPQHRPHHPRPQRRRHSLSGCRRPSPQPAQRRATLGTEHSEGDPHPSPLHRPTSLEPPAHRPRPDRPRQHHPRPPRRHTLELPTDWIISTRPAHPALVSEADFITVQNLRIRRETTSGHTYLLAGLLCCGICSRRMESHWTHHRPGYRCRHGHTSATQPDPGRAPNAYLREDQVLPHLPALHLRLTSRLGRPGSASVSRYAVHPTPTQAIAHLRSEEITLTYDPAARTLTANTPQTERITIS